MERWNRMPELPEVETIVRALARSVRDLTVETVSILRGDILRGGSLSGSSLAGARVAGVERVGKNVVLLFEPPASLVINLGMTGRLLFHAPGERAARVPVPHRHAAIRFSNGGALCYHDARRFGSLLITKRLDIAVLLGIGKDPFQMSARELRGILAKRNAPVKAVLLDQKAVSGLGNIYADETLYRARVHPATRARKAAEHAGVILSSARAVLRRAIRRGGTTLRDYRTPDGSKGSFQHELAVYGRTGQPCTGCGAAIQKTIIAGRGTHFCPSCQRPA
jgi:formamidopyrimidine-DNA glycosylase